MKLKIYGLLIIKFLLSSSIFASNPPLPAVDYPIQVTFNDDTGSIRLRWADDPDQFLTGTRAPADPEKCRLLTYQHFQEIRMQMQTRIKRQHELELSVLNDQLVVQKQIVTPYNPLPSISSITQTATDPQLPQSIQVPQNPLTPRGQSLKEEMKMTAFAPNNPVPFKPAERIVSNHHAIKKLARSSESIFRAITFIQFHDTSEPS
jgi:hypothetical protein